MLTSLTGKREEGRGKKRKMEKRKAWRLVVVALYSFCLFPSSFPATSAQTPTFRTGTTLVEFTVVALDDKGNPVTDLTQAELSLKDRGQPRDIAFFRFDGDGAAAPPASPPVALPPGFVTNRPEYQPEPQKNVTAIVLDFINTAPPDQDGARSQLMRYLKTLPSNTPVGLFRFTENQPVAMVHSFTNQAEVLKSHIGSLGAVSRRELIMPGIKTGQIVGGECGGGGPMIPGASASPTSGGGGSSSKAEGMSAFTESESKVLTGTNQTIRNVRISKTLDSLEALGNHLSAIPGRKSVVWISSGMPIHLPPAIPSQSAMNHEPPIRRLAQQLANQGIAVYPVDAKGGCRALDKSQNQGIYGLNDAPQHVFGTFDVVADVTGGRVVKYTNDFSQGVVLAANDQRGTYTVGFYASDEPDDRWHSLQLETKRRGITLRHRQGYHSASRAQPQSLTPEVWGQIAGAPLGSSGVRLNGRIDAAGNQVTLALQIAAGDLYFHEKAGQIVADLEIGFVQRTAAGPTGLRQQLMEITLKGPLQDQRAQLIPIKTAWPLNEGTSEVRVIVRDRLTGRYGTLDIPLSARQP
jgi:VWFA-related protein